nr:hypothetical protein [Tanacetum cinerariifolium]
EENAVSKTNQEPPQDSDIHQLIEECSVEVPEEQKQKMENTMFDLVIICQEKEFLCIHDDVDDFIKSALDSKLLSINSINSQCLDKKEQEVKSVEEQPAGRRNLQDGNSQQEEIDIGTETDDVMPPSVENADDDYDLLLGEADLFLSDDSIPPGIENVADDPEGDPDVIAEEILDKPDEHFNPGREINASTKIEDDDYFLFMFVIRFFLPYFIFPEVSPLLLSAESEDTIFDPGISD